MMSTLYIGATGLKTHGTGLNTISNNLANVNTVGYKQQSALFQDLMSEDLPMGNAYGVAVNQRGLGSQLGDVRTLFSQGGFEPGNEVTDLAIGGKGFFQVMDGEELRYTRAGNFRFDDEGVLRDPAGFTLMGFPMTADGQMSKDLTSIQLDQANATLMKNPSKASSNLEAVINIGSTEDISENATNPYFSLLSNWNGAADAAAGKTPLMSGSYTSVQPMKVYDSAGRSQTLNVYFDGAPSTGGQRTVEYLVAADPAAITGPDGTPGKGTGALMSGTLTFSSSGQLLDMTAFVPTGGDPASLASWTPAPLVNGVPQFNVAFAGAEQQSLTFDLGIRSEGNAWARTTGTAADVGTNTASLPSMGTVKRASSASTSYEGASSIKQYRQDGHSEGDLADVEITEEGVVRARYTNSETVELYTIPLFRFTSEDGLRREGNNHYSAPEEAGTAEWGLAKTSNYGSISSRKLETSNVDMSREMANLIIMQRGFQMNSKSINTADTMLQKAMEIKR